MIKAKKPSTPTVPIAFYVTVGKCAYAVRFLDGRLFFEGERREFLVDPVECTIDVAPSVSHIYTAGELVNHGLRTVYEIEYNDDPAVLPPPHISTFGLERHLQPRVEAARKGIATPATEYVPTKVVYYRAPAVGEDRYKCPMCKRKPYVRSNPFWNHIQVVHGVADLDRFYEARGDQTPGVYEWRHPRKQPPAEVENNPAIPEEKPTFDVDPEDDSDRGDDWKNDAE